MDVGLEALEPEADIGVDGTVDVDEHVPGIGEGGLVDDPGHRREEALGGATTAELAGG